MSYKEMALHLIDNIPESKMIFVVNMLENLQAYAEEEIEPDEWDLQMIESAKQENDGNGVSIETLAAELGIAL